MQIKFFYRLSTSGSVGYALASNSTKYVYLDLSDSTFTDNSVTNGAFQNTNLTGLIIPNGVTSIGTGAFNGCASLAGVKIPDSVTSIGYSAFENCARLANINIPNTVTTIGAGAFKNCAKLASVSIPNRVTIIAQSAFSGCAGLISVTIPNSVTAIAQNAFENCTGLTSVTIPNSITSISDNVFYGCTSLTSVTIPNSVTSIGNSAFENCSGLSEITIPNNVASIAQNAFDGCAGLTAINVDAANSVYSSENGILYNKTKNILIAFPAGKTNFSFTIPNHVTVIQDRAFYLCVNLTRVTIHAGVSKIGDMAFYSCVNLTRVTFAAGSSIANDNFSGTSFGGITVEGVFVPWGMLNTIYIMYGGAGTYTKEIGSIIWTKQANASNPFEDFEDEVRTWLAAQPANTPSTPYTIDLVLNNLGGSSSESGSLGKALQDNPNKYVYLDLSGSTIDSIGNGAFFGCTSLASVTIPDSVTSIEDYAFSDCINLAAIHVTAGNSVYSSQDGVLFNKAKTETIYVPKGISGNFTIPNSVTIIRGWAFLNCTRLASVTIPDSVTSIGNEAFAGCISLAAINVGAGNSVYSSQDGVLYNKAKTEIIYVPIQRISGNFTIPNSVTIIGDGAFYNCSLTSVTIPNSVTSIGNRAFSLTGLTGALTIPNSVTIIGDQAFYNCSGLTSVTIGSGVTSIGDEAFQYCTRLTSVTIPNGVTSIGTGAFSGCTSLASIEVAAGNTAYSSQDGVVYNKTKTTLVSFPSGKTGAFTIPNGVTSIRGYAFSSCSGLVSVTIPNSVTSIAKNAFYICSGLVSVTFQGTIPWSGFIDNDDFYKDLRDKFYALDSTNGTPGTYTRASGDTWTKQ